MPPNMSEIAEACGVSRQTVGLVLSGRKGLRYSKETCRKVREAARKLGYRANAPAVAMRKQRFDAIAFAQDLNYYRTQFSPQLLVGVEEAARERGQALLFSTLANSAEFSLPKPFTHLMVDGFLMNYHGVIPERVRTILDDDSVPVVWLNTKADTNTVYLDDYAASVSLVERLLDLGHRDIGYFHPSLHLESETEKHYSEQERYRGYLAAVKQAGIPPRVMTFDSWFDRPGDAFDMIARWLDPDDRPTAIISAGFSDYTEVLLRAAEKRGLQVPEDLSIMAFLDESAGAGVSVSGVSIPWRALGAAGVSMVHDLALSDQTSFPAKILPLAFNDGATAARWLQKKK